MVCRQPGKRGAKAVMLLAMLWFCPLSIMAYPPLLMLNDKQVSYSNQNKEDSILKHYAEILQQMALRVPTQGTPSKEQATTTINSDRENKIEEATMDIPEEILEKIPVFLNSPLSKSKETKPEVPLMEGLAWPKEKLEFESSIRHPREQEGKDQEKMINIATEEAAGNTENTDKDLDHSDMENMNLEDDDSSVLETDKCDGEDDVLEEPAVDKAGVSTLEQTVKLAMDSTQKPCKKVLGKLIVKPLVKEAPKPVPKAPTTVHQKSSLDPAFKLLIKAYRQAKKKPAKRVMSGQMALVVPLTTESPGTQVHDLGTVMSPLSEEAEAKDQSSKEQVVEDRILKKISDINAEIKWALKNLKHCIEFKDYVDSAQKYLIQSLFLVDGENTSSNEHKPQVNKRKG